MFWNSRKPGLNEYRQRVMSFRARTNVLLCAFVFIILSAVCVFGQGRPAPRPAAKISHYAVYLSDQPVVSRFAREALETQAAVGYRRQIETRQAAVMRDLESRQIHVTGSVSTLLNAVFIATTDDR